MKLRGTERKRDNSSRDRMGVGAKRYPVQLSDVDDIDRPTTDVGDMGSTETTRREGHTPGPRCRHNSASSGSFIS